MPENGRTSECLEIPSHIHSSVMETWHARIQAVNSQVGVEILWQLPMGSLYIGFVPLVALVSNPFHFSLLWHWVCSLLAATSTQLPYMAPNSSGHRR